MPIVRINEFHAPSDKAAALQEFLSAVIAVIEAAPGCQSCQLLVAPDDASRIAIIETWDSIAAHQAAASLIPAEKLAQVRPLLAEPPQGRYYQPVR